MPPLPAGARRGEAVTDVTNETVRDGMILCVQVGSGLHGIAVKETDDRDEMAVFIEPPRLVIGLSSLESWVWRTQPEGTRSGPGDLDFVAYGLRKFVGLALRANPSILCVFFAPAIDTVYEDDLGRELRSWAPVIASRRACNTFLGYMTQQRERLLGLRGQKRTKRPELVERHGFDTKYAGHMIRLGLQGVEYLQTGRLTLPMAPQDRDLVRSIREGHLDMAQVVALSEELEAQLVGLKKTSPLPEHPDTATVEARMIDMYMRRWAAE